MNYYLLLIFTKIWAKTFYAYTETVFIGREFTGIELLVTVF